MLYRMPLATLYSLLMVYTPAEPASAATRMLGQIMVNGQAKINGVTSPSGATVFAGDQVATEVNSVAELTLNGGSKVMLPESTAVVLNNDAAQVIVNLKEGALALLSGSTAPAFVDANGARIRPLADAAVVLEVAVHGSVLKVLARRGSATVETADQTLKVEEGKELDATMAPPPPQGPAGAQAAGRSRLQTWVFVTALAGGLTGLTLGIIAITRPNPADCTVVSPSGPGSIKCP